MSHTTFGKQLKEFRLQKRMTQKDIANFLEMTPTAISDYETGCAICFIEIHRIS